jgi:hypothetical protein
MQGTAQKCKSYILYIPNLDFIYFRELGRIYKLLSENVNNNIVNNKVVSKMSPFPHHPKNEIKKWKSK